MALGIAAFCLIAIFSLLPIGLQGNLETSHETKATGILSQVVSDLNATPPTTPRGGTTNTPLFAIPIPANPVTANTVVPPRYFGESGYEGTTATANSLYRVDLTFLTNGAPNAATMATLKASWPATAATPQGKVETFIALDRN